MAGKFFIGNSNNIATLPKNILVGDSNNIARKVKGIYVGNSQNKAVKVWPSIVVPDNYVQFEWFFFQFDAQVDGGSGWIYPVTSNVLVYQQPRIVINFQCVGDSTYNGALFLSKFGTANSYYSSFNVYRNGNYMAVNYADPVAEENFTIKTNESAGIDSTVIYTLDYNNIENNISRFYLSATDGYYSIKTNQLLGSTEKKDYSTLSPSMYYSFNVSEAWPSNLVFRFLKIFNIKIYDNTGTSSGSLIHDYYPCYKTGENVGFYDIVDKIFIAFNCPASNRAVVLGPTVS